MIFAGNDFDAVVNNLRQASDQAAVTNAILTAEVTEMDDTQILAPVSIPHQGNGNYRVTLPGATFAPADHGKRVKVVIIGTSPILRWDLVETVQYRG